jgi:hypothetical protein
MNRILAALAALALSATVALAAPVVNHWDITTYPVFQDTLVTGANQSAGDTVYTISAAIPVFGARAFVIEAYADTLNPTTGQYATSLDTIATPLVLWDVSGTGSYAPLAVASQGGVYGVPTGSVNLTICGNIVSSYYASMDGTTGGTPVPITHRSIKLKMKNNTQRFKNYTNAQILTVNGPAYNKVPRLTVRIHVMR